MTDQRILPIADLSASKELNTYLETIEDKNKRADCEQIIAMMTHHSGYPPHITKNRMIGFGRVKYRYPSGHEGETFLIGFAPRKNNISLHILWYPKADDPLLAKLGKHKPAKGCLYINKLSDVDPDILNQLIHRAATDLSGRYIVEHIGENHGEK